MSTPVAAFCQLLVENTYGELAAQVFETLCTHGRLSLPVLIAKSGLTPRQAKHSLAILVQQGLVVWSSEGSNENYEVHVRHAYNIVRQAKLLRVIADRYGKLAESLAESLIQVGFGRVGDLVKAVTTEDAQIASALEEGDHMVMDTNGDSSKVKGPKKQAPRGSKELANAVRATVLHLVDVGFLTVVHSSHFHPAADNRAASTIIQSRIHGDKVKKAEEAAFNNRINDRLTDWQYNRSDRLDLLQRTEHLNVKMSKKRSLQANGSHEDRPHKKSRVNDPTLSELHSGVTWNTLREKDLQFLDPVMVRLNYDKLSVIIRNEKLTSLANLRIGRATSLIYSELLNKLGGHLLFCKDHFSANTHLDSEDDDQVVDDSTTVLTRDIAFGVDLKNVYTGFGTAPGHRGKRSSKLVINGDTAMDISDDEHRSPEASRANGHDFDYGDDDDSPQKHASSKSQKSKVPTKSKYTKAESDGDGGTDDDDDCDIPGDKTSIVKQHLLLLKEYEPQLARPFAASHLRNECWTISFPNVSHHLRLNTIDDIIRGKFGQLALRLVRILREKGRLEQKHLANFSLMNHKTQLALLTALHTSGYLDLQEVPKDSTRAPSKTIFLWFFDERRCATKMLEDTYKAMTRVLQRVRLEGEKFRNVIEKVQRSDVEGHEDDMLTSHEKQMLEKWHHTEERLLTELDRLDDVVFALRDF